MRTNRKVQKIETAKVTKRGRKPLPESEKTPEKRFIRIAGVRTWKACKILKSLRACSNTAMYSYNESQAKQIIKMLRTNVDRLESALMNPSSNGGKKYVTKVGNIFTEK